MRAIGHWNFKLGMLLTAGAVAAAAGIYIGNRQEAYRSIEVYTLEGSASITREKVGRLAAYENLYLESGDTVRTEQKSSMRLKLDDDKYVLAQENTLFELVAEGTRRDSKTRIDLREGAIVNEIQNPLSGRSSYEIHTPNAVMAVRGTCFRIEVRKREDGSYRTVLDTFDGSVSSRLRNPDGTVSDEEVPVNAGWHIEVGNDENRSYYPSQASEINYEDQPAEVLEFLNETLLNGREIGISQQELRRLLEHKQGGAEAVKNGPRFQLLPGPDASDRPGLSLLTGTFKQPEPEPGLQMVPVTEDGTQKGPEPSADHSGTGSIWTPAAQAQAGGASDKTQVQAGGALDGTKKPGAGGASGGTKKPGGSDKPKSIVYRVTFLYQGKVFGTQEVEEGALAGAPTLAPAAAGSWDYDFAAPVTSDLTIRWQ